MNQPGSFIPRQAPVARVRKVTRSRVYLFSYVAYVILFATLLTVVGLFLWDLQLSSALSSGQKTLEEARAQIKPSDIETVHSANARLELTSDIINSIPTFSSLFVSLAETTAQNIVLENFEAEYSESSNDVYSVSFSGIAPNFSALLFQRDVLEQSDYFKGAKVTDMKYESTSESSSELVSLGQSINFTMTMDIPVDAFAYDGSMISSVNNPEQSVDEDEVETNDALTDDLDISTDGTGGEGEGLDELEESNI